MIKSVKKVAVIVFIAIIISSPFTLVVSVYATPIEYENYASLENKRKEVSKDVEEINKLLEKSYKKIENNEKELIILKNKTNSLLNKLDNLEIDILKSENILSERLREIYKSNGQISYIFIFFNSKNLSDLIRKLDSFATLIRLDKQLIENLFISKEQLTTDIDGIEEEINKINEKIGPIKDEIEVLTNEKKVKETELESIIKDQLNIVNKFSVGVTGDALTVLNEAYKHLGKPYVWGAKGPDTFDCSGFTSYVYRHSIGIEIGVSTYVQIKSGREVSYSELHPGDLVFPHLGHVGIYIGNGQMIHAPRTGDVVKVAPVYNFWRGRRILE